MAPGTGASANRTCPRYSVAASAGTTIPRITTKVMRRLISCTIPTIKTPILRVCYYVTCQYPRLFVLLHGLTLEFTVTIVATSSFNSWIKGIPGMKNITRRRFFQSAGIAAAAPAFGALVGEAQQNAPAVSKVESDIVYGKGGDMDLH